MLSRLTVFKGDLHIPDLVREAAERSLQVGITPLKTGTKTPFGSGRMSIQEVQPGLRSESVSLTCHTNQDLEILCEPIIACNILLEGSTKGVVVDDHGELTSQLNRATLTGFGKPSRWVRHLRKGQFFKTFAFAMQPTFFERFAHAVDDQQLAVFESFRHGQQSMLLPHSQRLVNLGHCAFDHPYSGALDEIYHESNTLQFVLEVAKLLNRENLLVKELGRHHYDRLMHAQFILDEDLIAPPKTLDLAQQVGTNINTLQVHFKRVFNTTIFGYLRMRRLEMARVLITEHNLSSKETAYRVGFSNPAAFTAAYRRHFGHPPSMEIK